MPSVIDENLSSLSARTVPARPFTTAFARVEVATDPSGVLEVWRDLEVAANGSPYQTSRFLLPWLATEGRAEGIAPFIVTAYDQSGRAVALLPFGLRHRRLMRIAGFLGGKHANYNMGLFRPGSVWAAGHIEALLRAAAASVPGGPDLYALVNQPFMWNGFANPLATLPRQISPSAAYSTPLPDDPAVFFALNQSNRTRKALRDKRERLEAIGPVRHLVAASGEEAARVLAAFLDQKIAVLDAAGVAHVLDRPAVRDFLRRAATPIHGHPAALELHALLCGDRIVAAFGGAEHAGRFSGMLLSHEREPAIARTSPGHLLLTAVIGMKCRAGCTSFDLGIGESSYKDSYCPVTDPLFDSFVPVSAKGRLWAAGEASRLRTKGFIKQSPRAWAIAQRLRRLSGAATGRRGGSRQAPVGAGCETPSRS